MSPTRVKKQPNCGSLNKYLVGAIDLISLPTNIVSFSIVPWSPTSH